MANVTDLTDVLYYVELTVLTEWEREPALLDLEVADVYAALARRYVLEDRAQSHTLPRLSEKARHLHDLVLDTCEALLGRRPAPELKHDVPFRTDVTPSELATCFKRLSKSVARWSETGGRQGYLEYIAQFVLR